MITPSTVAVLVLIATLGHAMALFWYLAVTPRMAHRASA